MRGSFWLCLVAVMVLGGCQSGDDDDGSADDGGSSRGDAATGKPQGDAGTKPSKDAGSNSGGKGGSGGDEDGGTPPGKTGDEDGGTSDPMTMMNAVPDPAPGMSTPGEYSCAGCPDADVSEFMLDLGSSTAESFSGTVTGADGNGEFYLESADGQSIGGVIPTTDGAYSFDLPLFCGTQLLKCVWSNDSGQYVAVVQIVTKDCVQADIRLTLTWDNLGYDFELHLIKEGGRINDNATDCTWTSCIGQGPDWGVSGDDSDDPRKDVDNTGNYGPENIFYAKPEVGRYTVMVEHWGAGTADADGQVTINLLDEQPTTIDITNLASHHVFTAATIDWPSKKVTTVASDYDCSANWAGGCLDAIP